MCGIAGKVSFTEKNISSKEIQEMNSSIKHRGPDAEGIYVSPDKKVGLGHCRLAIIDLSELGKQPMRYLDRYEIVYNGEIYNFQELRKDLEANGYAFRSHSDTEVLLALYDKYKEGCVEHLRGMFSFALYDEQEKILFCARDRVGKKPFKFYIDENVFLFGSELKAILSQPEYTREPDFLAIHHFLTLQYCPAPLTGFKGIQKLEPATTLTLNLKTKELTKKRYWKLDYSKKLSLPEKEWKKRILETLDESVRLRMISDVPLGAFLSGGIDSSAVVAFMSRHSDAPIRTFSIGFKEEKYNELPYAKMIAEKFKTDHTEFIVEPNAVELFPFLAKQYEEPFADSSALPTFLVSKLTREHVTVALNGDGGDENFAGYGRYSVLQFSLLYEKLFPLPLHNLLIRPGVSLLAKLFPSTLLDRADRFSKNLSKPYQYRYVDYICYFTNEMKERLYTESFKEKVWSEDSYRIVADRFAESGSKNKTEQAMYADFTTYLSGDLLAKVDIATMATGLEGRSPFLDHKMLELTAAIPFHLKLRGHNHKKYILKKALEKILPKEVMYRPKMGFGIPIHAWFRNELKSFAYERLLSEKFERRGIFKKEAIRELLDRHCDTKVDFGYHIWALISLDLWFEEYFE